MRKCFAFLLILSILFLLSGCVHYKEDIWYSTETLNECLVPDLPQTSSTLLNQDNWKVYDSLKK